MGLYNQLAKYPVFTIDEVEQLTGNLNTACSLMDRLMKIGRKSVSKDRLNSYHLILEHVETIV